MTFTAKKDPVCGVKIKDNKITTEYKGKRYSFCSEECCNRFVHAPKKYIVTATPHKNDEASLTEGGP
jgi:YHS domain-containing protein